MELNKFEDEYVWKNYTPEYADQLIGMKNKEGFDFFVKKWHEENGKIIFEDNLVDNWKELYNTINRLNPASVFEFGCGACYHLRNTMTICPHIEVSGADYLESQIQFGRTFFSDNLEFPENVRQADLTEDVSAFGKHEFVFSQAVVMHLNSEKAIKMMRNMGKVSTRWILLIEGVRNHKNWYDLVKFALPEWNMQITKDYIDYGVLLEKV